jgi:HSF-type DNA-binding
VTLNLHARGRFLLRVEARLLLAVKVLKSLRMFTKLEIQVCGDYLNLSTAMECVHLTCLSSHVMLFLCRRDPCWHFPDTMESTTTNSSSSRRNIVSFDASSLLLDAATTLAQLARCASEQSAAEKQLVSTKQAAAVSKDQGAIIASKELVGGTEKTLDILSLPKWKSVFPLRLWELLNDETNYNASVIGWLPHGQSFIVHQPDVLMTKVLPKYIPMPPGSSKSSSSSSSNSSSNSSSTKTTRVPKFVSFTRKLHRWYVVVVVSEYRSSLLLAHPF